MYKILIVDNFSIVRSGLNQLLQDKFSDVNASDARSAEEVFDQLEEKTSFDLVLLGENLEDVRTEQLIRKICQLNSGGQILIFAEHFDYPQAISYFLNGATGYITKHAERKDIETAIRCQLNSEPYLSIELMKTIAREKLNNLSKKDGALNYFAQKTSPSAPDAVLSRRQKEIVTHLVTGESTTNIARLLNLKLSTVSTHKSKIFEKLHVNNVVALKDLITKSQN